MPSLTFYRHGQPAMRHQLKSSQVNIGRDTSCEIQLTDEDISRVHCSLIWEKGLYKIIDKSANGILVNDKEEETHDLQNGDMITVGTWRIKYEDQVEEGIRETVIRDAKPTKVLKFESSKKELRMESLELTIVSSDGKKKKVSTSGSIIGADAENDIVVENDPYISGSHCAIRMDGNDFIVEDLESKNGTYLNGEIISSAKLGDNGIITIGKTTIKYATKEYIEKVRPSVMTSLGPIIGKSEKMRELFTLIERIAPSDATACIIGASGTGKELVALCIHEWGTRNAKPFVALNCGAIPSSLIESELFGHERGSFTSATAQSKGVFEQANGGTLFLDEIGEMPLDLQTRLLRVLENKHIRRIGGQADTPVNVRIITATNRDLQKSVKEKLFREDLFFRLYVVPIFLPTLSERKEDIQLLAEHFLNEMSPDGNPKHLSNGALNKLLSYDWPGNVRELKNTLQRAILLSKDNTLTKEDLTFCELSENETDPMQMDEQKRQTVITALENANGNTSLAARNLGVARTTLASMVKKYQIDISELKIKRE